jgi:TPR repeat protein
MDDREAARLYKLAADQGNALAQVSLAAFYETGRGGLQKDDREAARLYKLAADQGNATGQTTLGVFYETGRGGLPKDDREAARLYKLAADQGNAAAQAYLGIFYEQGRGGPPKDDREALICRRSGMTLYLDLCVGTASAVRSRAVTSLPPQAITPTFLRSCCRSSRRAVR